MSNNEGTPVPPSDVYSVNDPLPDRYVGDRIGQTIGTIPLFGDFSRILVADRLGDGPSSGLVDYWRAQKGFGGTA